MFTFFLAVVIGVPILAIILAGLALVVGKAWTYGCLSGRKQFLETQVNEMKDKFNEHRT